MAKDNQQTRGSKQTIGRLIRRTRWKRHWSLTQLAQQMRYEASRHGEVAPAEDSLRQMISRWENDRRVPDEYNRHLLAAALGVEVSDLGMTEDPDFVW